eukprot:279016-Prymnesium_polylepis.1
MELQGAGLTRGGVDTEDCRGARKVLQVREGADQRGGRGRAGCADDGGDDGRRQPAAATTSAPVAAAAAAAAA